MKRLSKMRDDDDPLCRHAAQLLSAVEPLQTSEERMLRVRRGMERKRAQRAGLWHGPRALVLAAAALLVFAGSTLAAAQSGVLQAVIASVSSVVQVGKPPSMETKPSSRASKRRASTGAAHRVEEAPLPSAAIAPPAPVVAAPESVPTESAVTTKPETTRRRTRERVLAEDNELVRRAVKALRRDHDAALAARLLEEAHVRSPHGALAEEVLSLRVEAALVRKDARAATYAREYLAAYPSGRYRARVEQALR